MEGPRPLSITSVINKVLERFGERGFDLFANGSKAANHALLLTEMLTSEGLKRPERADKLPKAACWTHGDGSSPSEASIGTKTPEIRASPATSPATTVKRYRS